ncbi:hypothetical protein [Streptomyces sp. NRRL S-237]|uniref:hypothetical protein n=1 Tax=Streptomyces sp. NRRL S-237 TaxID=1463895 RepID=UPI000A9A64DC|nr:hypothetical protein [Streptomyces sp. NRRL S-237]
MPRITTDPTTIQTPATPAAPQEGTAPATNTPTRTVKVMAILVAVLCGALGSLLAFALTRHLGATALVAIGSAGVTFLGVTGTVKHIEEKLNLL